MSEFFFSLYLCSYCLSPQVSALGVQVKSSAHLTQISPTAPAPRSSEQVILQLIHHITKTTHKLIPQQ